MEKTDSFLSLLHISPKRHSVVAAVGAGGKTSLLFRLGQELVSLGKSVVITTTTHMAYDEAHPLAEDGEVWEVERLLSRYGYTLAASFLPEKQKLCALPKNRLRQLRNLCDVILIEADGAHRKPLKVPEEWEPVIPDFAELVIGVAGLDCLGKPIGEVCHRMERTASFLQKNPNDRVTADDVIKIAGSQEGLLKNVNDRDYRVYLNKADVMPSWKPAEEIQKVLAEQYITAAFGSLL